MKKFLKNTNKTPCFNILEIFSFTKWVFAPFFKIGKKDANTHFETLKISNKLKAGCFLVRVEKLKEFLTQ